MDELRWKSRIEVSLDNRQIFLLFFASAVIISLVFALGIVIGKRMHREPARVAVTDPLTLLDQLGGDTNEDSLIFQEGTSAPKLKPAKAAPQAGQDARYSAPQAQPKLSPKSSPPADPAGGSRPEQKPERKPVPSKAVAVKTPVPDAESGKKINEKPRKLVEKQSASAEETEQAVEESGDSTYTLQLSAFQERKEAELFMQKLRAEGLKPYMTQTTIPGRGVWFRVRLGRYKTWDEALSAKQGFEKKQKIIAYVSKS
jgi:DedD protein